MRSPAGVLCRALLFDSFVKGYFVLAYTNQYPYPASSTSRRSLSLIYRDRLAISYRDHAQLALDEAIGRMQTAADVEQVNGQYRFTGRRSFYNAWAIPPIKCEVSNL